MNRNKHLCIVLFFLFLVCESTVSGIAVSKSVAATIKIDEVYNIQLAKQGYSEIIDTLIGDYAGNYRAYIPAMVSTALDKLSETKLNVFASPLAIQVTDSINNTLKDAAMKPSIESFQRSLSVAEAWFSETSLGKELEKLFATATEHKPAELAKPAGVEAAKVESTEKIVAFNPDQSLSSFIDVSFITEARACSSTYRSCTNIQCPSGTRAFSCTDSGVVCQECGMGFFDPRTVSTEPCNYCSTCPTGTFSRSGSTSCTSDCSVVCTSPAVVDSSTCTGTSIQAKCFCPAGTFASSSTYATLFSPTVFSTLQPCTACPSGSFQDQPNQTSCKSCGTCPAGSEMVSACTATSDTQCRCLAGHSGHSGLFSASSGVTCSECASGYYTATAGSAVCQACPAHEISNAAKTGCVCDAGARLSESGVCEPCPQGTYKSEVGNTASCLSCPIDATTLSTGSTSATDCLCNAGYYSNAGHCQACPLNTYKDSVGSGPCYSCPSHSTSPLGSTAFSDCSCDAGYHLNLHTCSACPVNHFASTAGSTVCDGCPAHSSSAAGSSSCLCDPGYTGEPHTTGCTACPAGTFKDVSGSQDCSTCPGVGQTSTITSQNNCVCAAGYGYSTFGHCELCEVGKYKSHNGNSPCTTCEHGRTTTQSGSTSETDCVCAAGFQNVNGHCTACEADTYNDQVNGHCKACSSCPHGSHVQTTCSGSTDATCTCSSGYKSTVPVPFSAHQAASGSCELCDGVTYLNPSTNTCDLCLPCPANSRTVSACSSTSQAICTCNAGTYGTASRFPASITSLCNICLEGYSAEGATGCTPHTPCTNGFEAEGGSTTQNAQCICKAGKYVNGGSCVACPANTYNPSDSGSCHAHHPCHASQTVVRAGTATSDYECTCPAGTTEEITATGTQCKGPAPPNPGDGGGLHPGAIAGIVIGIIILLLILILIALYIWKRDIFNNLSLPGFLGGNKTL